jgi:prepilin-type N-terminal cleavage/methylation domain-containing protein
MHRGFTLIELLITISILSLLMGMATAGVYIARRTAAKTKNVNLIAQLATACESYRTVNGSYPGEKAWSSGALDPWKAVFESTTPPLAPKESSAITEGEWRQVANALIDVLVVSGESSFKKPLWDGFSNAESPDDPSSHVIRYRPARWYPYASAPAEGRLIDGDNPPNRDSVQIWAVGADASDKGGSGDDQTNWIK